MTWLMDPFCRHCHHRENSLASNMVGHVVVINIIFKLTGNSRMSNTLLNERGKIGRVQYSTLTQNDVGAASASGKTYMLKMDKQNLVSEIEAISSTCLRLWLAVQRMGVEVSNLFVLNRPMCLHGIQFIRCGKAIILVCASVPRVNCCRTRIFSLDGQILLRSWANIYFTAV